MAENDVIDEMNETEEAAEPDVLTCPVCGEEVEPGTENCPLCGAPVGTLENNDISGTSIDNSAAIDAMLQSAAMLVEESAALGVSLDDDEEETDDTDEEGLAQDEEEDEDDEDDEEEADPMEPAAASAMPTDLTDEQKSQIAAGGMINLNTSSPEPAPKKAPKKKKEKEKKKKEPAGTPVLYEVDESGNPLPEQEDKVEAPYTPPAKKAPKPKKKQSSSPVLVIAAAVVALALGCAVGFFGKMMFFPDIVLPECQEFAQRAVTGVNSVVDGEIYITEAYVEEGGDATQCVFRAAVGTDGDAAKMLWYRVKVYKDAPDTVRIYFQLDMDRYNSMISSDDDEQRIQASMLMSNQQELDRCIGEIQSGSGGWSAANAAMLNDVLHPAANKSSEGKA